MITWEDSFPLSYVQQKKNGTAEEQEQ